MISVRTASLDSRRGGLIVFASVGSGHSKAAEAIYCYLQDKKKDINLGLIDILNYSNILFKHTYIFAYNFLVRHTLILWSFGFWITSRKILSLFFNWLNSIIYRLSCSKFISKLTAQNPDFIISTHFLTSQINSVLKTKKIISAKLITLITDYGVHPFWVNNATDLYIVASDYTKKQLMHLGVREEAIAVLGMPIDRRFLKKYEKGIICQNIEMDKDRFTVLIVTGSFGIGPIEKIVGLLYQDVQILVVCANNKRLQNRLNNKGYNSVKVFGFVDNMPELMSVSDLIITKPGGLTVSEILYMELAPIFICAIPGQETENLRFLEENGIGRKIDYPEDIKNTVLTYKRNPEQLNEIRGNMRRIKKTFSIEELYNVVC